MTSFTNPETLILKRKNEETFKTNSVVTTETRKLLSWNAKIWVARFVDDAICYMVSWSFAPEIYDSFQQS